MTSLLVKKWDLTNQNWTSQRLFLFLCSGLELKRVRERNVAEVDYYRGWGEGAIIYSRCGGGGGDGKMGHVAVFYA